MEQKLNEEKQKALSNVPYSKRDEASTKIDKEISRIKEENKIKIKNDVEKHFEEIKNNQLMKIRKEIEIKKAELYQKAINEINLEKEKRKNDLNERIIELNKYINNQNKAILDIENTIKNGQILKYATIYDKKYLVEKINLSLIGYYDNKEDNGISLAPIRGGCLPEINNKLNMQDISEMQIEELNQLIYKINEKSNSEEINADGKNYINLTINLLQGNLNENFCQNFLNFNSIFERQIINSIKKDENISISDEYGNNSGIYKIILDNSEKIKNQKEFTKKNIFGENAAFYIKNDEDVEKLLSFGVNSILETETENDLNPFLISVMSQNREVSNSLVDYISASLINSSNESKYTPLHFACLYNYYELANSLIKKGAKINVKTRNNYYTPMDILIAKGNYETLELLLNNRDFYNLINEKNHLNSTPFHNTCMESIMCTKLLLKNRNMIKDINGNLLQHYAFFGGRIDIYNLIARSDIKEFNEYITSIRQGDSENLNDEMILQLNNENDFLIHLCNNLNKGNVLNTKKIIKYYQKNPKLKKSPLLKDNLEKIIISMCNGRNPILFELINEIINFDDIPIAPYIGKYGLISFIKEMKNMNINMFSKLNNKSLLDFAIENKNEDIIIEFFKNIEEISNENLSKYLTKILMRSKKLFNSVYNYIISEDKFKNNIINFDYLYNKDSLPIYFKIFLNLDKVDKKALDLYRKLKKIAEIQLFQNLKSIIIK